MRKLIASPVGVNSPGLDQLNGVLIPALAIDDATGVIYANDIPLAGGGLGGVSSVNGQVGAVVLTAASVGAASTASPAFSGAPTAPTPTPNDGSTKLATTAYVDAAVTGAGGTVLLSTVVLQPNVIAALGNVAAVIVSSPGPGKALQLHDVFFDLKFNGVAYDVDGKVNVFYGNGTSATGFITSSAGDLLFATQDSVYFSGNPGGSTYARGIVADSPIVVDSAANQNAGDGVLTVSTWYSVITLS